MLLYTPKQSDFDLQTRKPAQKTNKVDKVRSRTTLDWVPVLYV